MKNLSLRQGGDVQLAFKAVHLGPAATEHANGKTTWRWHADDDDDRYVEATDSLYSPAVVLLARDGHLGGVEAIVLSDPHEIVDWVWKRLITMGARPSPRGRRLEPGAHAPPEDRDEPEP